MRQARIPGPLPILIDGQAAAFVCHGSILDELAGVRHGLGGESLECR
jgi:hypothetical protein